MKFITALAIYYMLWSHHFAETCEYLQHIGKIDDVEKVVISYYDISYVQSQLN